MSLLQLSLAATSRDPFNWAGTGTRPPPPPPTPSTPAPWAEEPAGQKLQVSIYPQEQTAGLGDTVEFHCTAVALVRMQWPTTITWAREGSELPSGRSLDDGDGKLELQGLHPEDSGAYICLARSGSFLQSAQASLMVAPQPDYGQPPPGPAQYGGPEPVPYQPRDPYQSQRGYPTESRYEPPDSHQPPSPYDQPTPYQQPEMPDSGYQEPPKGYQPPVSAYQAPAKGYQPPVYPNQPPVYPNQPPAYSNQPPAYPNQPPAYPNQPPAHPNQSPTYPNQPPAYPTEPPVYPNQPSSYPKQPPAYPNQPPAYPTEPPAHPNQSPAYPSQPPSPRLPPPEEDIYRYPPVGPSGAVPGDLKENYYDDDEQDEDDYDYPEEDDDYIDDGRSPISFSSEDYRPGSLGVGGVVPGGPPPGPRQYQPYSGGQWAGDEQDWGRQPLLSTPFPRWLHGGRGPVRQLRGVRPCRSTCQDN